jgi:hypothetical protein
MLKMGTLPVPIFKILRAAANETLKMGIGHAHF